MADDLEREDRRLRDKASEQFDRLLAHSPDDPVEEWARDLFELGIALREASCSQAALHAPIEQSTTGAEFGKSMLRNAIHRMPLESLIYHLGYHVARFDEMRLYWYRVKDHVWSAFAEDVDNSAEDGVNDSKAPVVLHKAQESPILEPTQEALVPRVDPVAQLLKGPARETIQGLRAWCNKAVCFIEGEMGKYRRQDAKDLIAWGIAYVASAQVLKGGGAELSKEIDPGVNRELEPSKALATLAKVIEWCEAQVNPPHEPQDEGELLQLPPRPKEKAKRGVSPSIELVAWERAVFDAFKESKLDTYAFSKQHRAQIGLTVSDLQKLIDRVPRRQKGK
ncbi:MAG: hypothetical protein O3C40_29235 [Planctomycetota bacterium]|nr:hypothetical protein [Planctomycetota bacterium]